MNEVDKNTQLLLYVVSSFEMAAMQGMGKINNPVTGKIEVSLEQSQFAIDVLEMLKDKTKGNLTDYETRFLDTVSRQLKLNYVEENNKKTEEINKETEKINKETEQTTENK